MYLKLTVKMMSIVFVLIFLGIGEISAQDVSCSVQLEVSKNGSETLVTKTNAKAVNKETGKMHRSILQDGMPFFGELPKGEYRITVSKAGYYRSADDFYISCDEEESYTSYIELYRGTPRKIVKLYNRPKQIMTMRLNVPTIIGTRDTDAFDDNESGSGDSDDYDYDPPPPPPVPRRISAGVVNGKASTLPAPEYPAAAKVANIKGSVSVAIVISKTGKVMSASAVSGHPLLRNAAVEAARKAEFQPTLLSGQPVEVSGVLVYNFQ